MYSDIALDRLMFVLQINPMDTRRAVDLFEYLDNSLNDLPNALATVISWNLLNGVICDYLAHALTTGIISANYLCDSTERQRFTSIVNKLFGVRNSYSVMFPTIIYLCGMDLLYPEDLGRIIKQLPEWSREPLAQSADYVFGNLSVEELAKTVTGRSYNIDLYIRCCAAVSEYKTVDLVERLLNTFGVEELFQKVCVPNNSYATGWMLLAETVVVRAGGKRLSDYDTKYMTRNAIERKEYLTKVIDSQV